MGIFAPPLSATGSQVANVTTAENTNSTSYVQLTTTTDQVTVIVGASGMVLASFCAISSQSNNAAESLMGVDVSGNTTIAASDVTSVYFTFPALAANVFMGKTYIISGLTSGSNVFKLKYRVVSGTGTFSNRNISVVPL